MVAFLYALVLIRTTKQLFLYLRLTHKNVNSIEIFPGDGSVLKSEGAHFGNYFTYYPSQEDSEKVS